jgi:hypothetical protein
MVRSDCAGMNGDRNAEALTRHCERSAAIQRIRHCEERSDAAIQPIRHCERSAAIQPKQEKLECRLACGSSQ